MTVTGPDVDIETSKITGNNGVPYVKVLETFMTRNELKMGDKVVLIHTEDAQIITTPAKAGKFLQG